MSQPNQRIRGRRPARGEPVLDRMFRILECFEPAGGTLSLTQLSVQAELPKATALRLARKLAEWGALEQAASGEYQIGVRLLEIASLAPRGHGLRASALPFMQDLHHATREHVVLAVRDGGHAVVVEQLSAHRAGRVTYRVGGRIPLRSSGVGLVLLAFAPGAVQQEVLAVEPADVVDDVPLPDYEIRVRLAALRRDRFVVTARQAPEPMTSVAAPIVDGQGATVAALSVITRSERAEPATHIPAVIAVTRAISRAISGGPRPGAP